MSKIDDSTENYGVYESSTLEGEVRYRLGIIDFLTSFTTAKRIERKMNSVRYGSDAE